LISFSSGIKNGCSNTITSIPHNSQLKFKIQQFPDKSMVKKSFHTGTVKKTIKIKASKDKVWRKISNIVGLPTWVVDVGL
jgi:hypothetical protein